MSSSDSIKWIDLRDQMHPARLKVGLVADEDGRQRTIFFLMGIKADSPRWNQAIERLGFRPSATRKYLMRVRADDEPRTITPAMFHPVWANAQAAMMDRKDAVLDLNAVRKTRLTEEPRTADETRAAVETGTVRRLGRNAEGDEVFASAAGRFVLHGNGARTFEGKLGRPEMFLRAPDEEALDRCADGFVQAMLQGEVQHSENLDDFLLAVLDREGPYTVEEYGNVQSVVDAATVRFLHGAYETASEAFGDARLLYDNLPGYRGPRRGEAAMPLPLSVIAQRLLGDTKGLRIAVPQPWDGASFAFFPPGTEILAAGHEDSLSRHAARVRVQDVRWLDARAPDLHQNLDGLFYNADPVYGNDGSREDLVRAMTALRGLKAGGRAVLVLAAGAASGEITPAERTFFSAIARRYDVESAMQLPEALTRKLGSGACLRLVSLRNRPPVGHSLRLEEFKVVAGWDALKSEVDEVLATAKVREAESESIDVARAAQENHFQRPYVAFSKVSEPRTMVPANLQEPLQAALAAVEQVHGPVDAFVERSLGFGPHTLGRRFSAEQVDALALALHRGMQGRGMIIGDETGIGKGRQLAGVAVFANKQNCPIVFITDRANLFSDFVRDLRDIEEWGRFRPLITNADGTIVDVFTNEVLVDKPDPKLLARAIEEHKKPGELGVNLIFTTYSQISGEDSPKADWLREIIGDCLLISDEAHVAAGSDSNISRAIVDLTTAAKYVAYSSATWAKTSENLHVYGRALPESINVSSLAQTMRQGGEAFSELFSSMLARDGAFIRREHDLSKVDFIVEIDDENRLRNEMLSDRVSEVLAAMTFVGGEINKLLARLNDDTVKVLKRARAARVGDEGGNLPQARVRAGAAAAEDRIFRSSFGAGSVLYQVMRRSLAVMNADNVARSAIRAVAENRKPVIIFDDTGEAFVRRIVQREMIPGIDGERPSLPDSVDAPTVRDLLRNVIQRLGVISYDKVTENDLAGAERAARRAHTGAADAVDEDAGADEAVDIDAVLEQEDTARSQHRVLVLEDLPGMTAEQAQDYRYGMERILQMIEALPPLPLNAIDVVQARLAEAGITYGEISGRQLRLEAPAVARAEPIDSPAWSENKWHLHRRDKRKRTVSATAYAFNNGDLDAVCVNRSAATGISLHASPRFADTRQREIEELQIPEDPTNRIQLYGRVNRFDQVITPIIRMCTTGIYGEVRALMMQNKKLARLSANVRSSRENAAEFKSIPDLLNTVGRDVCHRFLMDNGGIRSRLGITDADLERPTFDAAARLTSRVALLKVSEQRTVYEEITEMYNDEIARYELSGENPLKPREFDWRAKLAQREIVTGIDMEGLGSTFDGPVFLTKVKWRTELKPIMPEQAFAIAAANSRKLVDAGVARDSSFEEHQALIEFRRQGQNAVTAADAAQQPAGGDEPAPAVDRGEQLRQDELELEQLASDAEEAAVHETVPHGGFMPPSYSSMENAGMLPSALALGEPDLVEVAHAQAPDGATLRVALAAGLAELAEEREEAESVPEKLRWMQAALQVPVISLEPIARRLAKILEAKMILELPGTRFADVQAALAAEGANGVKRLDLQRRWVLQCLPAFVPGAVVDSPVIQKGKKFEERFSASYLVLDLKLPPKGKEHNLARWKFEVITPGDEKPRVVSLATLMDELDEIKYTYRGAETVSVVGGWRPQAHVHDVRMANARNMNALQYTDLGENAWHVRPLLREFDWMPRGDRMMTAHVLDGNMYMASEWAAATRMGSGVVYTDEQGVRHRGVMLHKSMLNRHGELSADLPVRLWSPEMIGNFMWRLWSTALDESARTGQGGGEAQPVANGGETFDPAIIVEAVGNEGVSAGASSQDLQPPDGPVVEAGEPGHPVDPAAARRLERERVLRRFIPQNGPAQTYFFNTDLRVAMKGTGGHTASTRNKPVVALRPGDCLMLSVAKVDAHRIDRALKAEAKRAFTAAHPEARTYTPERLAQAKEAFLWPELRGGGAKKGGRAAKGMAAIRIPVRDEAQLRGAAEMIARAAGIELYLLRGSMLGDLAQVVQEQYFEAKKDSLRERLEAIRSQSQTQAAIEQDDDAPAAVAADEEEEEDGEVFTPAVAPAA
ncbi:MAG: hypothetical protein K0Q43_55 [Ramlibacter sp.]|jgi:hypothetical protein|nr:hypothetical protein [Ramlibacter sp.]